ncbi:MAG TPA: DUF5615 family PIN-like protein [Gemmataceae bacterium]|nr:DUF5615 family PIN-like protein [Gemmataceae bacterium]
MKFLLDVCSSSHALQSALAAGGHEVVSAVQIDARASDAALLALALAEQRILLTQDKDFGELIFVRGLPHGTIVRFVELTVDAQIAAMQELLQHHADDLHGSAIITVTPDRIRIRRAGAVEGK